MREEREKRKENKNILNPYSIFVRTLSYLKVYYSMPQNFDTFNTPHDALFLVFGVLNAKCQIFGIWHA